MKKSRGQSWSSWSGFTFENICFQHITQIKSALGLSVIYTEESSWVSKYSPQGAQIDMLIDRDDKVIQLIEIKYSGTTFVISKKYAEDLRNKLAVFRSETRTKKNVFLTMITTYGISPNQYSLEVVHSHLTLEDLFT